MKPAYYVLIALCILATIAAGFLKAPEAEAAFEGEIWQERFGSWIETIWPEGRDVLINGENKYLNFGTDSGVGGYGVRDNGGVIECKSSGGAWEECAGGGSGAGTIGTSTDLVAGQVIYATDADSVAGDAGFTYNAAQDRFTGTYGSTTAFTAVSAFFTNVFIGVDTLAEYIADTAGAMVSGNTESGISVSYDDSDNTLDFTVAADTGNIVDGAIIEPDLNADNSPSDRDILTYDTTGTNFNWESGASLCTAITGSADLCDGSDASGGGGSGSVGTSSQETATYVPFWTSTNGTPALVSGGESTFAYNSTDNRLTVSYASTTGFSSPYASSTNLFAGLLSIATSLTIGGDTFDELVGDGLDIASGDLIFDCSDVVGTALTCTGEDIGVTANGIGDTQLAFDTGQTLTTASSPTFAGLTIGSGTGLLEVNSGVVGLATAGTDFIAGGVGANTQVAYFTGSGVLAGDAGMTYDAAADRLTGVYASTTGFSSGYASTTRLGINNDLFTDLTGAGLIVSSNALTVDDVTPAMLQATDFGNFTCNGATCTIDNTSVTNAMLANSTISGIALGSNLADLTATNATLTFSGSYNGGTARTVGINLANPNTWTGLQTFTYASSTGFSTSYASSTVWRGGGLTTDCDTGATSKLLWDSTTGQFSCGTDQGGAGGSPGGSDGQLQFNDGGAFGGAATTFWDDVTNKIGFGSSTPFGQVSINPDGITGPAFVVGSSTKTHFMITNSGVNVFGTANPQLVTGSELVQFEDEDGSKSDWSFRVANGGWGTITFGASQGTLAVPTVPINNDSLGSIIARGWDGSASYDQAAEITFFVNGEPNTAGDTSDMPGGILFSTSNNGSSIPAERMRIETTGHVGIGTSTPWARLSVGFENMTTASYAAPIFSVATTSNKWGELLGIYGTTTPHNSITIPASSLQNTAISGLRAVFGKQIASFQNIFFNGTFSSSWQNVFCDGFKHPTTLSADALACDGVWFDEGTTATLSYTSSAGTDGTDDAASLGVSSGTGADSAQLFMGDISTLAVGSTTPSMEVLVGAVGSKSSTTSYFIGWTNSATGAITQGCYLMATTTTNWQAICQNSAANITQIDTGVNATDVGLDKFRINYDGTKFSVFHKSNIYAYLVPITTITTNMPTPVVLSQRIGVRRAGSGTAVAPAIAISGIRYWRQIPWWWQDVASF